MAVKVDIEDELAFALKPTPASDPDEGDGTFVPAGRERVHNCMQISIPWQSPT